MLSTRYASRNLGDNHKALDILVADEESFGLIHQHSEYLDRAEDAEVGVLNLVARSFSAGAR